MSLERRSSGLFTGRCAQNKGSGSAEPAPTHRSPARECDLRPAPASFRSLAFCRQLPYRDKSFTSDVTSTFSTTNSRATLFRHEIQSLFYRTAMFITQIYRKIYPADLKGDVAVLPLLGAAVISHLVNSHFYKKISAVEKLFSKAAFRPLTSADTSTQPPSVFTRGKHAFRR